ncbi:uncharacterized protein LOC142625016 [Castanea sativa]|uniref:uncharacterized protein LOC142625016 n=1 Tax=Castanea sativa TaxID=21020 RepID=UPI003F6516FB
MLFNPSSRANSTARRAARVSTSMTVDGSGTTSDNEAITNPSWFHITIPKPALFSLSKIAPLKLILDIPNLAIEILHQGTQRDLEKFSGMAWRIWYSRNQVLYKANGTSEAHIWGTAIRMIEDFKEANGLKIKYMMDKKDHWEPRPVGFYTINVDGAIPLANGHSRIGVIVRDSDNKFVAAMSVPLQGRYYVEETEATAVEQGCVLAKKLGLERVIIESDSLLTVQAVEANDVRGIVSHIVKGIVQSLCSFQE